MYICMQTGGFPKSLVLWQLVLIFNCPPLLMYTHTGQHCKCHEAVAESKQLLRLYLFAKHEVSIAIAKPVVLQCSCHEAVAEA